jgi:hypothetical protein
MATSFKTLGNGDIQSTRNKLHESIPITGSITSGTYVDFSGGRFPNGSNIKNYAHGMFQSCFDYPYLSSSANHIFDLTVGYSTAAQSLSSSAVRATAGAAVQMEQKINMYNQMAQVLVGYDATGSIKPFSGSAPETQLNDAIFINYARLLGKDEIQKGTFSMLVSVQPSGGIDSGKTGVSVVGTKNTLVYIQDVSGTNNYRVDSPAGEYNVLVASSSAGGAKGNALAVDKVPCGYIYYQAGIVVLTSSLFTVAASGGLVSNAIADSAAMAGEIAWQTGSNPDNGCKDIRHALVSSSISESCNGLRARIHNVSYSNTTELNSTVYFCRANANDFNYSSNPTYITASKIRVKEQTTDEPLSYITTVGMYGANNELLAVAKLSEPLKKTPSNEFTLRVRLDY